MHFKTLFFCAFLLVSHIAYAQSTREQIEQLKYESEDLAEQIEYFEKSLTKLNDALNRSKRDLTKQEQEFIKQKAIADNSSDPADQRSLNLIENAVLMNKRSISTQERRIKRQSAKLEQSRDELIATYKAIGEKEAALARASRPTPKPKPKPEPKPVPKVAVKKPEPVIAAPQVKQETTAPEASSSATAASVSAEKSTLANTTSPTTARNAAQAAASATPSDTHSFSNEELEKVQDIMDKLAPRLARDPGRPILRNVVVQGQGIADTEMTFLGQDQYRANVVVPAGSISFEINGRRYREKIEEKDAGKEHVLLLDAKRFDRQRLYVFRRDILNFVDAPIE